MLSSVWSKIKSMSAEEVLLLKSVRFISCRYKEDVLDWILRHGLANENVISMMIDFAENEFQKPPSRSVLIVTMFLSF